MEMTTDGWVDSHHYTVQAFEAVPYQDAIRLLAEQAIASIEAGRVAEVIDPAPIPVTAGMVFGEARVVTIGDGDGYHIHLSDDQPSIDALIALLAHFHGIHGHARGDGAMGKREECICQPDRGWRRH